MAVAERTITVCDLDRETVEATTHLAADLGGKRYELDLCEQHAAELRSLLSPAAAGGRGRKRAGAGRGRAAGAKSTGGRRAAKATTTAAAKAGSAQPAKAARGTRAAKATRAAGGRSRRSAATASRRGAGARGTSQEAVRTWARENGMDVKTRGRLPASIVAAYQEAHPAS